MKLYFLYVTIFAFATCFQAASGRTRQLKSTSANTPNSGFYSTLSSTDHLASPVRRLFSSSHSSVNNQDAPSTRKALNAADRIAFGQEASPTQFPFVIYFDSDGGTCSGSVIAPRVVLTAAHCVWDDKLDDFIDESNSRIYFNRGFTDDDYGTDAGEIKSFYIPKEYSPGGLNFGDVALIELVKAIPASIKPIALASAETKIPAGTVLTVAGWGEMETNQMASKLMYTTGKVMDRATCESLSYEIFDYELDEDHFCVDVPQNTMQTTCGGDSGGPYMIIEKGKAPVQVGATSFGPSGDCGSTMRLDVPVSIKYWRTWIDNTMAIYNLRGAKSPVKLNVPVWNQCYKGTVVGTKMTVAYGNCLDWCRRPVNAACQAWTWQATGAGGTCTLFKGRGTVVKSSSCTSGYFI